MLPATHVEVPFHGDTITCVETADGPFVAMRLLCESMGLDFSAQRKKLMADKQLFGVALIAIPNSRRMEETTCIPVSRVAAWLFMLQPSRVKPELKAKVELYRLEAADVLDRHFRLRASEKDEELALAQAQLDLSHLELRAADPKVGQVEALLMLGVEPYDVATRVRVPFARLERLIARWRRCGILLPKGVKERSVRAYADRIETLEYRLERALERGSTTEAQPELPLGRAPDA